MVLLKRPFGACQGIFLANAYEANEVRRAGTIIFINPTAPTGQRSAGTVLWDGFRIPSKDSVEN